MSYKCPGNLDFLWVLLSLYIMEQVVQRISKRKVKKLSYDVYHHRQWPGLITLRVVSLSFWMFPRVFTGERKHPLLPVFTGVLDTNMLVSKTPVKTGEKQEKITQSEKNARRSHYALGKTRVSCVFSCILERLRLPKRKPSA